MVNELDDRRHLASHVEKLSRLVDADDVVIKPVDRGLYFSPSTRFIVRRRLIHAYFPEMNFLTEIFGQRLNMVRVIMIGLVLGLGIGLG